MKHGGHFNLRLLERSKAAFDNQQRSVTASCIFQADRIIIGLDDPFPIVFSRLLNRFLINTNLIIISNFKVPSISARCLQFNCPLSRCLLIYMLT